MISKSHKKISIKRSLSHTPSLTLALSLSLYIYIYIYICVLTENE